MQTIFPWQQTLWKQLTQLREKQRLPHSLLLSGAPGLGKSQLARNFAEFLLCSQPNALAACGDCQDCKWLAAQTHPDFLLIQPEAHGLALKIEQVRDVIERVRQTTQSNRYKVVMLEPAENLTTAAANALLKILEEPPNRTLFILVSHQASQLPATIRSRCQHVQLPVPPRALLREWLQKEIGENQTSVPIDELLAIADDSPLQAAALAKDNTLAAIQTLLQKLLAFTQPQSAIRQPLSAFSEIDLSLLLRVLYQLILDLIKLKLEVNANTLTFFQKAQELTQLKSKVQITALYQFLDHIITTRRLLVARINLNEKLQLEQTVLLWGELWSAH